MEAHRFQCGWSALVLSGSVVSFFFLFLFGTNPLVWVSGNRKFGEFYLQNMLYHIIFQNKS